MPSKDLAVYLEDILASIENISLFVEGMKLTDYVADIKSKRAVERELQILTEAGIRMGDEAPLLCPGIDWRGYRGFGNFLRHSYHLVSDEVVWDTIKRELPELKKK